MKTSYFAEKFLHTFALLTCSMVLCSTYSTAQVFRKYIPPTDESNRGRCIINLNTANDYLTVGDYYDQNTNQQGHALWTDDDGLLLDQRNYHDGTAAKYDIRMIAPETVQGSYSTVFPYQPRYQGHPIVGTQIIAYGSPAVLVSVAWVAILNPTTKNIVWSHIIDNIADDSLGIAVVRDNEDVNTFYVLSNLTNFTDPGRIRFAVTKYSWAPGNVGHQLMWSKEYDESADNAYFPASGMTQDNDGYLIVTGTKNSTSQRVFAIRIDKGTGAHGLMHYLTPSTDNAKANSITYSKGFCFIAGSTQNLGYVQPMLIKVKNDLSTPTYLGYIIGTDSIAGEFTYAKRDNHSIGSLSNPATDNISAVGFLDNGEAVMMNVDTTLSTINWTTTFNDDYASGSATVSKASWFDADRGTGDNFMCTGTHSILSTGAISVLNGVVRKYDGFNECGNYPETEFNEPDPSQDTEEIESEDWFTTDPNTMDTLIPTLNPYYCSFGDTYYGKRSINEQSTIAGLPSFTARYADNAIHIQYSLSQESPVEIIITDILGNTIAQETFHESIGSHQILYEAHHLSSGAYILSIRINDTRFTQHLNIIK
jgi:hypothetical protein